ncbi:MAG: hypothetical protein ACO3JL_14675, partial [Myxococcota bacterium]
MSRCIHFGWAYWLLALVVAAPARSDEGSLPPLDPADATTPAGVGTTTAVEGDHHGARAVWGSVEYRARRGGGVDVIDRSDVTAPVVVATLLPGVAVSQLFVVDDTLLVVRLEQGVQSFALQEGGLPAALLATGERVDTTAVATAVPATEKVISVEVGVTPAAESPQRKGGKVLEVTRGRIVFELGTADGVVPGSRVRVLAQRLIRKPDLIGEGNSLRPSGEVSAVVTVEEADEHRAMAVLGRGDVAVEGDLVEVTSEPLTERLFLPRRANFRTRAGFVVRPFLDVGVIGGGALAEGYAYYTLKDLPLTFGVELQPVAFNATAGDGVAVLGGAVSAHFTTDFFEVGIGAGSVGAAATGIVGEPYLTGALTQHLRLGSLDGLHLAWRSAVYVAFADDPILRGGGFGLGSGRGELNLPVSRSLSLFGAGSFGLPGVGFGEIGVRTLFFGTGNAGTLALTTSLGGSAVGVGGGPAVSFG